MQATFAIQKENFPRKGTLGVAVKDSHGKGWKFYPSDQSGDCFLVEREWLSIEGRN